MTDAAAVFCVVRVADNVVVGISVDSFTCALADATSKECDPLRDWFHYVRSPLSVTNGKEVGGYRLEQRPTAPALDDDTACLNWLEKQRHVHLWNDEPDAYEWVVSGQYSDIRKAIHAGMSGRDAHVATRYGATAPALLSDAALLDWLDKHADCQIIWPEIEGGVAIYWRDGIKPMRSPGANIREAIRAALGGREQG